MDVRLDQNDEAFVDQLIAVGRYGSAAEAVHDGLRILRVREAKLAALREMIESSIEQGGSYTDEEVERHLEAMARQRGREPSRA